MFVEKKWYCCQHIRSLHLPVQWPNFANSPRTEHISRTHSGRTVLSGLNWHERNIMTWERVSGLQVIAEQKILRVCPAANATKFPEFYNQWRKIICIFSCSFSARMARKLRCMECAKYMAKQEMQTHFGWNRSLNDIIYVDLFIYLCFIRFAVSSS
jgi:hypothetical protein